MVLFPPFSCYLAGGNADIEKAQALDFKK